MPYSRPTSKTPGEVLYICFHANRKNLADNCEWADQPPDIKLVWERIAHRYDRARAGTDVEPITR
jgi:hypothetical protein